MGTANTRTKTKSNSSMLARFLPVTAGTCLLVSATPCYANGHQNQQGRVVHPFVNQKFQANQQLRISRFAATGLEGRQYNLDLSSLANSVVLGSKMFDGANSVTIDVGGLSQVFHPGDQVTPGEFVAIQQVLSNAPQTLKLNTDGAATSGSFSLNQAAAGKVGDLVIPENVTAFDHFTANRVLGLSGDLTNNGSIYGYSTSQKTRSGIISADDITNSGLISTEVTKALIAVTGLQKHVDLTLSANGNFSNSGNITSSGNLTIDTAGGSLTNSGLASAAGDLNIGTGVADVGLNIDATGGTFSALKGDINIRDLSYTGTNDIQMVGGDYLSRNLNIHAGEGSVTADVGQVTGKVNTEGKAAHFYAATDVLKLGCNNIHGDPTWANTKGDIVINGAIVAAESIAILASGNITAKGDAYISTANATGITSAPTTNVTLVAGVKVTTTGQETPGIPSPGTPIGKGQTATVDFGTINGGNIDLRGSTHNGALIDTSSNLTVAGKNAQVDGGAVLLAAGRTDNTNGLILFPNGISIDTSSQVGKAGNVTIIAGGSSTSTKSPTIRIGTIDASTDSVQGAANGVVNLGTFQPASSKGTTVDFDEFGNQSGIPFITQGTVSSAGLIQVTGSVLTKNTVTITSGAGGGLTQSGGGRIEAGDLTINVGTLGIGSSKTRILTAATGNLNLTTTGTSAFVDNLGSFTLNTASLAANGVLDITTTANGKGNGQITLATDVKASSGTLATINLQSASAPGGQGGIDNTANKTLTATSVNLKDNADGLGTGSLGSKANPILTGSGTLNIGANTTGDVFLSSIGSVILQPSSAGNGKTFSLNVVTNLTNVDGQITLAGGLTSDIGRIGTINLTSSESSGGNGGITVFGKGKIVAENINLQDGATGTGGADIGALFIPLSIEGSKVSIATNGSVFVDNTNKNGVLLDVSHAGTTSTKIFSFSSAGNLAMNDITAGGTVIVSAGGKEGNIYVNGDVISSDAKAGTVTLIAGGSGSIFDANKGAGELTAVNVNLFSKSGGAGTDLNPLQISATKLNSNVTGYTNIYDMHIGAPATPKPLSLESTSAKGQFILTSDDAITITGAITGATDIKIATTTVIDNKATITVNNDVGSSKTTTNVELIVAGVGALTSNKTAVISSANLVSFSSGGGDIGAAATPLTVFTPNLSANTNGGKGIVNIAAQASKKVPTVLLDSSSDGDFTLDAAGSLTLTHLVTTDGSIKVTSAGSLLSTAPNADISVGSLSAKAPGARTITLQNDNAKGGNIFIGANSTISTFVTTPGAGSGTISILTGTPVKAPVIGTTPANVKVNSAGGTTFFNVDGITALAPLNTMNNVGADIIFDAGGLGATAITLGGGVVITADPPVLLSVPTSTTTGATNNVSSSIPAVQMSSALSAVPQGQTTSERQFSNVLEPSTANTNSFGSPSITQEQNTSAISASSMLDSSFSQFGNLTSALATAQSGLSYIFGEVSESKWISETELVSGEIPAAVLSDMDLGLATEEAAAIEIEEHKNVPNVKVFNLKRGVGVFAPSVDTYVNTSVGKIKIGARALALVMTVGSGVAVYDLDDSAKGSVEIMAGGKTITLCPGMHASITRDTISEFGDINPAQMIGYRRIGSHKIGEQLKAFTAEFSVPHAIHAVQPLKHLLKSKNPHAKKIAGHLMKTTAVLMQLGYNNGRFEQVFRSQKTAYNP